MMRFSDDRLMDAAVQIDGQDGPSKGRIVALFEGRQWTPMTVVRFYGGPECGRAIQIPLEALTFIGDGEVAS